jgi:hypothetical protein
MSTLLDTINQATIDGTSVEEFDWLLAQRAEQLRIQRSLETTEQRQKRETEWKAYLGQHSNK